MKTDIPATRRKFADVWDEIDYLYHKLLYWLYDQGDPAKAKPFAERLERLLARAPSSRGTIRGEECRSLICELKQDLPGAIKHREEEVRLIERLHQLACDSPSWHYVQSQYDARDLSDRLDLLAILYHDSGDLEKAIGTLQESKQLCKREGILFDGEDLLQEYRTEKQGEPEAERDRQRGAGAPRSFDALFRRRPSRPARTSRGKGGDQE